MAISDIDDNWGHPKKRGNLVGEGVGVTFSDCLSISSVVIPQSCQLDSGAGKNVKRYRYASLHAAWTFVSSFVCNVGELDLRHPKALKPLQL